MEALPNVLPVGRNSPQKVARGLYAEQLSGTAFTAPRAHNRRSWLYRVRPAAVHRPFEPIENNRLVGDFSTVPKAPPDQLRWDPLPFGKEPVDLVDSLVTMAGNGYTIQCRAVRFIYMPQRSR
jgi:homogentisate 1,2-dioxygenase